MVNADIVPVQCGEWTKHAIIEKRHFFLASEESGQFLKVRKQVGDTDQ